MNRETKGTAPEAPDIQHFKETSVREDLEVVASVNTEGMSAREHWENGKKISTPEVSKGVESTNTEGTSTSKERENGKGISTLEASNTIESTNIKRTSALENRETEKGISIREDLKAVEIVNTEGTSIPDDKVNRKGISTLEALKDVESANIEGMSTLEDRENGKGISTPEALKGVESANTEGTSTSEDRENGKRISTPEALKGVESANTKGTSTSELDRENVKGISTPEALKGVESANTKGTSTSEDQENGKGISTPEALKGVVSTNTKGTSTSEDRENGKGISTREALKDVVSANAKGTSTSEDRENRKGISTPEASKGVESANTKGTSTSEDRENGKGISTPEALKGIVSANIKGTSTSEDRENGKGISTPEALKDVESANTKGTSTSELDRENGKGISTLAPSDTIKSVNIKGTSTPHNGEIQELGRSTGETSLAEESVNTEGTSALEDRVAPTTNPIFYAPDRIRLGRQSDFAPKMVSIGPYFHRKDLPLSEDFKNQCMLKLLKERPTEDINIDELYNNFRTLGTRARSFYKEKFSYCFEEEEFIKMLIRDSCFIIHVILVLSEEATESKKKVRSNLSFEELSLSKNGQAGMKDVRSDLLLLENQIPLFFLQNVYERLFPQSDQSEFPPYKTVVEQFIGLDMPWKINWDDNVAHLLELYWRCSLPPEINKRLNESPRMHSEQKQPKSAQNYPWLVHATELHKKAGIKFKELNDNDHYEGLSVIFSNGIMRMPRLNIDSSQTTLLVNLIAFETSKSPSEQIFSGYIKLMDALINSEKDVEFLQQRGVICNTPSSSKMVATFFNDVGNLCAINSDNSLFFNLFSDVQKHYNSGWYRAWATLRHDYLKSPWGYISVTAATALLLLAFIQTGFTIYDHIKRFKHHH